MKTETIEAVDNTKKMLYTSYEIEQPKCMASQLYTMCATLPIGSSVKLKLINKKLGIVIQFPMTSLPVRTLTMKGKTIYEHDAISEKWLSSSLNLKCGNQTDLLTYDIHSDELFSTEEYTDKTYENYTDITDRLYFLAKELEG